VVVRQFLDTEDDVLGASLALVHLAFPSDSS